MRKMVIVSIVLAFAMVPAAVFAQGMSADNSTSGSSSSNASMDSNATGGMGGMNASMGNNTGAVSSNASSGCGGGMNASMGNNTSGMGGMNASMGNNTSTMGGSGSSGSAAYSMGVSKNQTGENATGGMNAGMENNTSGMGGMNASMENASNTTGTKASLDEMGNATGTSGMNASMGGIKQSYTYDQKDQMISDLKDQVKELDLRIETAKRHGDNSTARTIEKDRDRLKKQLSEVKKANRDNWDRVQGNTMDMLREMNMTSS